MISAHVDYRVPASLEEAVTLLADNPNARLLAGGLSLLFELPAPPAPPTLLLDLGGLSELGGLHDNQDSGGVRIGAMTTLDRIADSELIGPAQVALSEAARSVGDQQTRNRATLGGSLSANAPGADLPAAVAALGATVNLLGPQGPRSVVADDFFTGGTAPGHGEILVSLDLPAPRRSASVYEKFRDPASGYAVCAVAALLSIGDDGTIAQARLALTGATEAPRRLPRVESALTGQPAATASLEAAVALLDTEGLEFPSDMAASTEYRAHLAGVLTGRALARALQAALSAD